MEQNTQISYNIERVFNGVIVTENNGSKAVATNRRQFMDLSAQMASRLGLIGTARGQITVHQDAEQEQDTQNHNRPADGIYIVTNDGLMTVEEWKRGADDPTVAELVAIIRGGEGLAIAKDIIKEKNFEDAQQAASEYVADGFDGDFRCPTRKECIDIYDARFAGLDDAIALIGGEPIKEHWYWTNEADPDPDSQHLAFFFYGGGGYVRNTSKYYTHTVRPVSAFKIV